MSPPRSGRLVRALACDRKVHVLAVVADGPARELAVRHGLTGDAAVLAAEGLVAAVLLSSQVKGEERITLQAQSEHPRFALTVDVWGDGPLRARFTPPTIATATHDAQGSPRFTGFLSVVRSLHAKELYRGIAEVKDEAFEQALERYLRSSDQVDGRVRLQAHLDDDGSPRFAAGLLVERFPDTDPEEFSALFDQPLSGNFQTLMTAFAFGQLAGHSLEVLDARDLEFRCTCSLERVTSMLRTLGPVEVADMLEKDDGAEITCHFCNERYEINADQLRAVLDELGGGVER